MNPFRVRIGYRRSLIVLAAISIAALIVAACVPVAAPADDSMAAAAAETDEGGTLTIAPCRAAPPSPPSFPGKRIAVRSHSTGTSS